ncbi:Imidazolonepropionase [Kytococcus aerolatus]|uniref:Imidazolonepropionase n=1 Tax=Kytococcus aerolatus TaxID=592308 RepID=A0A212U1R2_9MICO|nr:amidohydrolase family protein [Kytococcus aerolatus]SNC72179.1 Imidazolonepropionase [Kytococcus aerolatus]
MSTQQPVLHLTGEIIAGPEESHAEAWVVDGRLTFDRPPASVPTEELHGFVLPGLVDAHCHVGLDADGGVPQEEAEEQAVTEREAGTLLLRDAGSPVDTSWIHDREDLPRLVRAGRHIARPKRYIRNFAHEIEPDQLVEYVRQEARAGDGWVKLVGDWIDREAGDLRPLWPVDIAREAIAAAHAEGARVTAHCFDEQSLFDLAEAGIDCIEHATGLTPESVEIFAARDIAIAPTLINIENFPKFAAAGEAKFPAYAAHMRDMFERRFETIGLAREAGVRVYAGTDAGGQLPHGLIAQEVEALTSVGMSATEAIGAATWEARQWLGHEGLAEGASADVVVYDRDPRQDVRALADPAHVVLRGVRHGG